MSAEDHKQQAGNRAVACAVITCSDTRTERNDTSGRTIRTLLEEAGHDIVHYEVVKDDAALIRQRVKEMSRRLDVQCVIFNGGTGISRRDNTYDAVAGQLTKTLPGFGELFRMISFEAVGSAAMLSRAIGGIVITQGAPPLTGDPDPFQGLQHTVVFSIPGSPNAVEIALTKLILPELSHLVWETLR